MNRVRISFPNAPPQFYPNGSALNPSANPDPNGTVLVTFPDGTEIRYPADTTFNVVQAMVVAPPPPAEEPAAPAAPAQQPQARNGEVVVPVNPGNGLTITPTTTEATTFKKWVAVLAALFLATLVGIGVYFLARPSSAASRPVTVVAPPSATAVTLPKCSDQIARCKALSATLGVDSAPCDKIDEGCMK